MLRSVIIETSWWELFHLNSVEEIDSIWYFIREEHKLGFIRSDMEGAIIIYM